MRKLGMIGRALSALVLVTACRSAPEPPVSGPSTPANVAPLRPEPAQAEPEQAQPSAGSAIPTYDASTTRIETAVGAAFMVALPANIATPMRWRVDPALTNDVLAGPTESYQDAPPADCQGCVGYGGTRTLRFEARTAGTITLRLIYAPLTDPKAPPERVVTIEVIVR